jgi:hypothetical protein
MKRLKASKFFLILDRDLRIVDYDTQRDRAFLIAKEKKASRVYECKNLIVYPMEGGKIIKTTKTR